MIDLAAAIQKNMETIYGKQQNSNIKKEVATGLSKGSIPEGEVNYEASKSSINNSNVKSDIKVSITAKEIKVKDNSMTIDNSKFLEVNVSDTNQTVVGELRKGSETSTITRTAGKEISSILANATSGLIGKKENYGHEVQSESEIQNAKSNLAKNINMLINSSEAYLAGSYTSGLATQASKFSSDPLNNIGVGLGIASTIAGSLLSTFSMRQYWTAEEYAKVVLVSSNDLSSGNTNSDITIKSFLANSPNGTDFAPSDTSTSTDSTELMHAEQLRDGRWHFLSKYTMPISSITGENSNRGYEISYTNPSDTSLNKQLTALSSRKTTIGFLYVNPIGVNGALPFKIPFEFNPIISESPITAKYASMSLLSRIGELQSYTGTSPLTISIKTQYLITNGVVINADAEDNSALPDSYQKNKWDNNVGGHGKWMDYYNEEIINDIEVALRSLQLPNFSNKDASNINYARPPTIKVVLANTKDYNGGNINSNGAELAYPFLSYDNYENLNILDSQFSGNGGFKYHKTFVVTSLGINKTFETQNAYYDGDNNLRFDGFSVEMSLVETTQAYTDALPDYNIYKQRFTQSLSSDLGV